MAGEEDESSLAHVQFGIVLAGAEPFTFNNNVSAVYRGQVRLTDGRTVQAFIKDIPPRELANELFASALASQLRIPTPLAILARVDPGGITATSVRLGDTDSFIVFATAAVPAAPVLQVVMDAGQGAPAVFDKLASWSRLGDLYAFDSWIANVDRHPGNLLFSGQEAIWLIDHGYSFTGPNWAPSDLIATGAFQNKLGAWLTPRLSGGRRAELAGQAETVAAKAAGINLRQLADSNQVSTVLGPDVNGALAFLEQRIAHIRRLSTSALGMLI